MRFRLRKLKKNIDSKVTKNSTIEFTKMTGAGNDFVLIDNRSGKYDSWDWKSIAPTLSNRRFGVGADGILIIEPSDKAKFRMLYFNANGSFGGMCGNGGRCASAFIMRKENLNEIVFEALDFLYKAESSGMHMKLQMKDPASIRLNESIFIDGTALRYHYVDTGSPHVVIFFDELPESFQNQIRHNGIVQLGQTIRNHSQFAPEGTNVNFTWFQVNESISMRTFERGVEAETLACGTGAVACSVIFARLKNKQSPIHVKTHSDETLTVSFARSNEMISQIVLEGSAKFIFEGVMTIGESVDFAG